MLDVVESHYQFANEESIRYMEMPKIVWAKLKSNAVGILICCPIQICSVRPTKKKKKEEEQILAYNSHK